MRHDYDLPPDWEALTDKQKHIWMTQERCRKQAMKQKTPTARKAEKEDKRRYRKLKAHPGTVPIKK